VLTKVGRKCIILHMPHNRTSKRRTAESGKRPPICDHETYSLPALKERGVGPRMWARLVKLGMPVDVCGNRILQRGDVVREWLAKLADEARRQREQASGDGREASECRGGHGGPPAVVSQ